ncbi:MAG: cysteine desulfurase [Candidatus Micrarchaeota archaeon]
MNVVEFRKNFPIVDKVVYFDNAATSLTPFPVLEKMNEYYNEYRANIHRGAHRLTQRASKEYERGYEVMAKFFNAKPSEFINVTNTTEAINSVALGLDFSKKNEVVLTNIEHHSNLLPWIELEKRGKVKLKFVNVNSKGAVDLNDFSDAISSKTALVTFTAVSNVLGNKLPVQEIVKISHDAGALTLVDAAQAVGHEKIDLRKWNCDFMAFSSHKCYGPTGVGALYHREGVALKPAMYGGGTVMDVELHDYTLVSDRQRFEAGTPNISGWIGLATALEFIDKNFAFMQSQEKKLVEKMLPAIANMPKVNYYGPTNASEKVGVFAFTIGKLPNHEVAVMFDEMNKICVRSGHHCAMPLHREVLGLEGTVRASLHAYNTEEEVKLFLETLQKITALA